MKTDGGEGMNIENHAELIDYLRHRAAIAGADAPACRTLPGGVSCRTVWVKLGDRREWVIKQALTQLRTTAPWFSDPARITREALGLRWLAPILAPGSVPELIFLDESNDLLAMSAVPMPHENFKSLLLAGRIDLGLMQQAGGMLGTIHRTAAGLSPALPKDFADRRFYETLRLEPYYLYSASQCPESTGFIDELVRTTRARAITLVHGDYSPKNLLIRDGRIVLLDHEVMHVGDPGFDVGFFMTHLVGKAIHLPHLRDAFFDAAGTFWRAYSAATAGAGLGDDLHPRCVRHTLGCMLARAIGRSPLEYLAPDSRRRLQSAAVSGMIDPPDTMPGLIAEVRACVC